MVLSLPWLASRDRLASWRTRGASTLVTPPDPGPVSLELFRALNRTPSPSVDNDEVLDWRLKAATDWVERYTGRALMPQTWRLTIDGELTHVMPILLPVVPVISITSVTSYNTAGTGTVMLNTTYLPDLASEPGRIVLNDGIAWPSGLRLTASLVIDYVAGYANVDLVPMSLKHAIVVLAGEFGEVLEASSDRERFQAPFGVKALLDPYVHAA